jgi:hypothetical protein
VGFSSDESRGVVHASRERSSNHPFARPERPVSGSTVLSRWDELSCSRGTVATHIDPGDRYRLPPLTLERRALESREVTALMHGLRRWIAEWAPLLNLAAAVLIAASIAVVLLQRHDDELECKTYQDRFKQSYARTFSVDPQRYSPHDALILTFARTWSYRPPGCPVPVPAPLR